MDLTEQNLETIASIHLHNMTIEEVVGADRGVGDRFHFSTGVWWREVKPFFHLPASFMTRIVPHQAKPNPWRSMGGYYHMVPEGVTGNGLIVTNEISDLAHYGLESIGRDKRRQIRRGLASLRIRRVEELNHLLGDGFRVYLDWERKTNDVRVKLSNPAAFNRWITRTFLHPYELILGAYAEDRLVAFLIVDAVEGVGQALKICSDSAFDELTPSSALYYAYVKICGQNSQIRKACAGFRTLKPSLEHYKSRLGYQHVAYPAFISLPPVIRPLVRWWLPTEYRRLMGQYETESPAAPSPPAA
jgi:hypothetical protein